MRQVVVSALFEIEFIELLEPTIYRAIIAKPRTVACCFQPLPHIAQVANLFVQFQLKLARPIIKLRTNADNAVSLNRDSPTIDKLAALPQRLG